MTRDIDLVVELKSNEIGKVFSLFAKDCYIDKDSIKQAIDEHSMFNIIHSKFLVKADFIIKKDEKYFNQEFARRQKVVIEDIDIYVVSAEDLILCKLIWAKESQSELQLRDVNQMIAAVSDLDWNYMKRWAIVLSIDGLLDKAKKGE